MRHLETEYEQMKEMLAATQQASGEQLHRVCCVLRCTGIMKQIGELQTELNTQQSAYRETKAQNDALLLQLSQSQSQVQELTTQVVIQEETVVELSRQLETSRAELLQALSAPRLV